MAVTDLTQSRGSTRCLSSLGGKALQSVDTFIGQTLGSFNILSLIGEGGMGRVYLGEHVLIGRRAAIKVLAAEIADNGDLVSRFFTEARAVNDIRHPNIVEVTDFGTFGSQPYIVMELLDGETLEERLKRARILDVMSAARVVAQVAAAVGAGHDHGMVHRDLKPANIFLRNHPDYPDFVKVLDFGIAKLVTPDCKVGHHTEMGSLIGTPAYMSPEQCLGDTHLDHRSDIYSLGVVLYQMVAGRLPFTAETAGRLIMSHVQETPPPPQSINPKIPTSVSTVILRAMAKKPDQRFASMREFREAILLVIPAANGNAGNSQITHDGLTRLLTPPPVVPTSVSTAATMFQTSPPPSHATPTPIHRSTATPIPIPIIGSQSHPFGIPSTTCSSTCLYSPASVALGSAKIVLIERLVELTKARLAPDTDPELPLVPRSILRCLDFLSAPDFSFGGMASLLGSDARLANQLIQVANTNGPTRSVSRSTEQAISRLGAEGVRTGLFEIALRPFLETTLIRLQTVCKQPWQHALAVATLSQRLMHIHGANESTLLDAYRGGLFHDAGKPIATMLIFDIEQQLSNVKGRKVVSEDMLTTALEQTHALAGARLARAWGLSPEAADAIEEAAQPPSGGFSLGAVIRLANALAFKGGFHTRRDELDRSRQIIDEARRVAGFDEETCHRVLGGLKDAVSRRL
jgi:putative nucleotidyltransferase with HDIG domain